MTRQLWIVMASVCLLWGVDADAQVVLLSSREALVSPYLNTATGMTLDEAIQRALDEEPALRATRSELDVAKGMLRQAELRPNPTVSYLQQNEPGGTDSQSRLDVQWPLDLFRKTGRVAVAEQERQATERGVSDRERILAADVRMKYGEVAAAVRDLSVSDDLVAATSRQLELLRARVDQGVTPPLERNIVEVEFGRLKSERYLQVGQVDRAVIELKRLLGLPANAPLQLRDTLEQLVAREADRPQRLDPTVVAMRADIQEAEVRIRVADAQIDRARREGRFDLSVFGSYMRTDAGFPQLGLNGQGALTPVRGVFHYLSAGAALTVPLRNQNQGEVAAAQAARAGATARLTAAQLTAQAEIANATTRDARARDAIAVYSTGTLDLARQNLNVVTETYALGRATVFEVLAEQRRYLDLEHAYGSALREAYEAGTALRRARGDVQ